MIKKFLILFTLAFYPALAQQTNPNVELPDFVITGTDVVAVRGAQKIAPEFISTISEQFFKPVYSPEELQVKDLSSPLKNELSVFDSLNYLNGNLEFGAGIYSLPVASLSYLLPVNDVFIQARLKGENHRPYIDNSERYLINGGLDILYTTDKSSEILPGTQLRLNGNFGSESFKFFGADTPVRRTLNQGNFSFGISNQMNRQFNFDVRINDNVSSINEENYNENILSLQAFTKVSFSVFNIAVTTEYKKQFLTINDPLIVVSNSGVDDFFSIRPTGGLNISDRVKISGGVSHSEFGSSTYTAPFAAVAFKINNFFSVFGEYSPHAEFLTSSNLLKLNRYYYPQNFYNFFYKKRNSFTAAVKYEYDKYYQVNAGIEYFNSSEYPFLKDSSTLGNFYLTTADAKSLTMFTDLLFHLGPYGVFYGKAELNETKNDANYFIPYHPRGKLTLLYGYEFPFGLKTEASMNYASESFVDISNTQSLPAYFDLGLKFSYKIVQDFNFTVKLSNLLGDDIYYWNGYKEPPLDLIAGFKYMW
jgi:hypothetical protein